MSDTCFANISQFVASLFHFINNVPLNIYKFDEVKFIFSFVVCKVCLRIFLLNLRFLLCFLLPNTAPFDPWIWYMCPFRSSLISLSNVCSFHYVDFVYLLSNSLLSHNFWCYYKLHIKIFYFWLFLVSNIKNDFNIDPVSCNLA